MAHRPPKQGGEGVSLQTLVIAALASGCAAVVTSYFWQKGTLVSAAMTPVIVTILSEVLKRPATTVKRGVSVAKQSVTTRERESVPLAHGAGAGPPDRGPGPTHELPAPEPVPHTFSEIKVYRDAGDRDGRRFGRIHWKIVLATAGIAFVIAVAALTLPELLFGSSVGGSNNTTLFGGSTQRHTKSDTKTTTDKQKTSTDQKTVTEQQTTTVPTDTATIPQDAAPPTQSTPAPQSAAPQQSTPQSTPPDQAAPPASAPPASTTP